MKKKYVMIAAAFLFVALIYIGTVVIRTKSAIISGTEGKDKVADVYNEDIVDIKLEYANTHRSFLKKSIGTGENATYCFGVRIFKNSEPVDLSGTNCQGYFKNSNGENIELTNYGTIKDNVAYVTLPQECYKNEGLFTFHKVSRRRSVKYCPNCRWNGRQHKHRWRCHTDKRSSGIPGNIGCI